MLHTRITAVGLGILAVVSLTACSPAAAAPEATPTPTPTPRALVSMVSSCNIMGGLEMLDDNHAFSFDGEGEDYDSDTATWENYDCLMDELDVPESLIAKIEETSSLDGRLSDTWGDRFEITWKYHPDNGLDFIVEETD